MHKSAFTLVQVAATVAEGYVALQVIEKFS